MKNIIRLIIGLACTLVANGQTPYHWQLATNMTAQVIPSVSTLTYGFLDGKTVRGDTGAGMFIAVTNSALAGDGSNVYRFTNAASQYGAWIRIELRATGTNGPSGPVGGIDVTGTLPDTLSVVGLNGTPLGTTTPTPGNILVAENSIWQSLAMSGDSTLSSNAVLTLANTAVSAGGYGSTTQVPVFVVDSKGRITGVTNQTIVGTAPGGAAGGFLNGTYPNPTFVYPVIQFTNVAAMVAYTVGTNNGYVTCITLGGTNAYDGMGGLFGWVPSGSATTNTIPGGGPFAATGGQWTKINGGARNTVGGPPEIDSQFTLSGNFLTNNIGDNRAMGIVTTLYPDPTGGGRSTEGINNRMSITLPPSGHIATIEGYHCDFSGYAGPHSAFGLWEPTLATVDQVIGFRMRGVTIPTGASEVVGLRIDADLNGGSVANYNIWSLGATSTNRFDGRIHTYGDTGHMFGQYGGGILPGGPLEYVGVFLGPNPSGTNGGAFGVRGVHVGGQLRPIPDRPAYGMVITPNIVEASTGAAPNYASLLIEAPVITDGGATVGDAITLDIVEAPVVGLTRNLALRVRSGQSTFGGAITISGNITNAGPGTLNNAGNIIGGGHLIINNVQDNLGGNMIGENGGGVLPGGPLDYIGLFVGPKVYATNGGAFGNRTLHVGGDILALTNRPAYGLSVSPSITEANSGNASEFVSTLIEGPNITSTGATVVDVVGLKVTSAPVLGTGQNLGAWIYGRSRFDDYMNVNAAFTNTGQFHTTGNAIIDGTLLQNSGGSGNMIGENGGGVLPGGPLSYVGLFVGPSVTSTAGGAFGNRAVHLGGDILALTNRPAYGVTIQPSITEANSGTHTEFASLRITAPTISDQGATIGDAATVIIDNAPIVATDRNLALWVKLGQSIFGGSITISGNLTNSGIFDNTGSAIIRGTLLQNSGAAGNMIGENGGNLPGGPLAYVGLMLGPTVSSTAGGVFGNRSVHVGGNILAHTNRNAFGLTVAPAITEANSGTHPDIASLQVDPAMITAGGADIGNATTLKVNGAPTEGATANRAFWVTAGTSTFGGDVIVSGLSASTQVFTGANSELTSTGTNTVAHGGTGVASFTSNGVLFGQGSGPIAVTAQGGANTILVANSGAPSFSSTVTVGTSVTSPAIVGTSSITDNGLTATRVVFAGTSGLLSNDSDMTFATDTLTVTKIVGSTSVTTAALTVNGTSTLNGNLLQNGGTGSMIGENGGSVPGGPLTYVGLMLGPSVTGTATVYGSRSVQVGGTITATATKSAFGLAVGPAMTVAGSGAHPEFISLRVEPPIVTTGVGTIDRATTFKITGAPTEGTVSNYSLWVDDGTTRLDGSILTSMAGTSTLFTDASGFLTQSGTTTVTQGGTGRATLTDNGVLFGQGAGTLAVTAQGGANTVLVANSGSPSFSSSVTIGTSVTSPLIVGSTSVTGGAVIVTTNLTVGGTSAMTGSVNMIGGFTFNGGASAGTYARGDGSNYVPSSLLVSDLTGGANATAGSGITLGGTPTAALLKAVSFAVDQSFSPTWTGTHKFVGGPYSLATASNTVAPYWFQIPTNYAGAYGTVGAIYTVRELQTTENNARTSMQFVTSQAAGDGQYGMILDSTNNLTIYGLTGSKPVFTDANKKLVSTGTLGSDQGGTGFSTYTTGDLIVASAANTLSKLAIGTSGQVLTVDSGTNKWVTPSSGSGTVTSVALALPTAVFDISGSPVTGSGTLTATFDNQNAKTFFAGPVSGGATTPSFRTIAATDLAAVPHSYVTKTADYTVTNTDEFVLVDPTSGNITITLPDGLDDGKVVTIKHITSGINTVTISAGSGVTVDSIGLLILGESKGYLFNNNTKTWLIVWTAKT